jgi:hypothetical protein
LAPGHPQRHPIRLGPAGSPLDPRHPLIAPPRPEVACHTPGRALLCRSIPGRLPDCGLATARLNPSRRCSTSPPSTTALPKSLACEFPPDSSAGRTSAPMETVAAPRLTPAARLAQVDRDEQSHTQPAVPGSGRTGRNRTHAGPSPKVPGHFHLAPARLRHQNAGP